MGEAMARIDRRTFLKGAAATAGAAALGGPFAGFAAPALAASSKPSFRSLRPTPDERDGQVRLWLPAGFGYRSFHDTESTVTLDDGTEVEADDAYLRRAILQSRADVVEGYPNVMPVYDGELSDAEVDALVAYLHDLSSEAAGGEPTGGS